MDFFVIGTLEPALDKKNTRAAVRAMARLQTFNQLHRSAAIILMDYDSSRTYYIKKQQLPNLISIYDFLQKATAVPSTPLFRTKLTQFQGFQTTWEEDGYMFSKGSQVVAKAFFSPEQIVQKINYFSPTGATITTEDYDLRGFKSRETAYDESGKKMVAYYFTPTGQNVLTVHFDEGEAPVLFELTQEKLFYFTEKALLAHLLKKLTFGADLIISDERQYDDLLPSLNVKIKLVATLAESTNLNAIKGIDGVLVSTQKEKVGEKYILLDESTGDQSQKWTELLEKLPTESKQQ